MNKRSLAHFAGAVLFVAFTGTAGVEIFGHSDAFAQQTRAVARDANASGNVDNGKKVFSNEKCASCHGVQGEGGTGATVGPQIAPPPLALPMFIDIVRNPKAPMPSYSASDVSDAALADVYAFLKSMVPQAQTSATEAPAGNIENGNRLFASAGCYECHDREGQGGTGAGPRLAPNPIAFSAFVRQCRQPADQMPPYTSRVLSDSELADIYAFLQAIPKPPAASSIPLLQ